jgi:hypothetical protein
MNTQPEALRLAEESENDEWIAGTKQWQEEAAAELRRLHEVNQELVEALELALEYWAHRQQRYRNRHPVWVQEANKALAKAKGETE